MRVEAIQNLLHFQGIPNGASIKKLISKQAEVRRQKLTEELNFKIKSILSKHSFEREEVDLYYQSAIDRCNADLDLETFRLQDEVDPDLFKEISEKVKDLVDQKIKYRHEWRKKKRDIDSIQNRELFEAQQEFTEQIDELADQLSNQLAELQKESIRRGAEMRHQVLASIRTKLPSSDDSNDQQ